MTIDGKELSDRVLNGLRSRLAMAVSDMQIEDYGPAGREGLEGLTAGLTIAIDVVEGHTKEMQDGTRSKKSSS